MTEPAKRFTYEEYIGSHRLPEINLQKARKVDPDEAFFVRTHQAFELWFAQVIEELEFVRSLLSSVPVPEARIPVATHHVRRAAAILELLQSHLPVLETLDSTSFFDFRRELIPASGFDSHRFRELEWLLGFLDSDLSVYVASTRRHPDPEVTALEAYRSAFGQFECSPCLRDRPLPTQKCLSKRHADIQSNGTLRNRVFEWLERTPYPQPGGGESGSKYFSAFQTRFEAAFEQTFRADLAQFRLRGLECVSDADDITSRTRRTLGSYIQDSRRSAILFILQFPRQPLLAYPASLLDALLELDEALTNWRARHISMVRHVLGGSRISTSGQPASGIPYLEGTTQKRAFPELWDARAYLLGDEDASTLYNSDEWKPFGFRRDA